MSAMNPPCHLMRSVVAMMSLLAYVTGSTPCEMGTFRQEQRCVKCGQCLQTSGKAGQCDPVSGRCRKGCMPGYLPPQCLSSCGACVGGNTYCLKGVCSLGCEQGYTGESCNIHCPPGKFGENCQKSCGHCQDGNTTCDGAGGACADGCESGWSGLLCGVQCPAGFWGPNCNMKCGNCENMDNCDKATGDCKGQCKRGWRGFDCMEPCPLGRYGKNCLDKCPRCDNKCSCNAVTGKCEKECKGREMLEYPYDTQQLLAASHSAKHPQKTTPLSESPALAIGVIALVLAIACVAGIFYVRRTKCKR